MERGTTVMEMARLLGVKAPRIERLIQSLHIKPCECIKAARGRKRLYSQEDVNKIGEVCAAAMADMDFLRKVQAEPPSEKKEFWTAAELCDFMHVSNNILWSCMKSLNITPYRILHHVTVSSLSVFTKEQAQKIVQYEAEREKRQTKKEGERAEQANYAPLYYKKIERKTMLDELCQDEIKKVSDDEVVKTFHIDPAIIAMVRKLRAKRLPQSVVRWQETR